jgi:hypothetical protein
VQAKDKTMFKAVDDKPGNDIRDELVRWPCR